MNRDTGANIITCCGVVIIAISMVSMVRLALEDEPERQVSMTEEISLCDFEDEWCLPIYVRTGFGELIVMFGPCHADTDDGFTTGKISPWGRCSDSGRGHYKFICNVKEEDLTVFGKHVYDALEGFEVVRDRNKK